MNVVDLAILVVLAAYRGWPVVAFAFGGFLLSFAYTAPPLRLKKRGLGEPDVLVVWGPLMVCGTYYAAVGSITWEIVARLRPLRAAVHGRAHGQAHRQGPLRRTPRHPDPAGHARRAARPRSSPRR